MTLAFILGGGFNDAAGMGLELHRQFPVMQRSLQQVGEWTGLDMAALLADEVPKDRLARRGLGSIRQAAVVLAISDLLAERGVRPGAVGGLSLGALTSGCLSGSVSREQYFGFLSALRGCPLPPDGPATSVAFVTLPDGVALEDCLEPRRPGLYLAADLGLLGSGHSHLVLISGYLSALRDLATDLPQGTVNVREHLPLAVHSPLQQYAADYLAPFIDRIDFRDPALPVVSCFEPHLLRSGAGIRSAYLRNTTSTVSIPHMRAGMAEADVTLGLILGPSRADQFIQWPFPVVQLERPEHLLEVFEAIHTSGVQIDTPVGEMA